MSSKKKNRLGPDKCEDGNVDTVCTTKSEPYPTIILDFGQPVDIAQVRLDTILIQSVSNGLKLRQKYHGCQLAPINRDFLGLQSDYD